MPVQDRVEPRENSSLTVRQTVGDFYIIGDFIEFPTGYKGKKEADSSDEYEAYLSAQSILL